MAVNPFYIFTLAALEHLQLLRALYKNPEDGICAFCQGDNTFVDDIGFFYCWPLGHGGYNGPTCKECYDGVIGDMHTLLYGCGER